VKGVLNFLLQRLQGAENQFAPEGFFFVRSKFGIAGWTDDAAGGNGAHRPDFLRHRDHRADLRDRNLQLFDLFADRCAAACARASGRGKDNAGDSGGLEPRRDPLANVCRIVHGRVSAACRVHKLMKLADHALAF
jgi:hypothetical protein